MRRVLRPRTQHSPLFYVRLLTMVDTMMITLLSGSGYDWNDVLILSALALAAWLAAELKNKQVERMRRRREVTKRLHEACKTKDTRTVFSGEASHRGHKESENRKRADKRGVDE